MKKLFYIVFIILYANISASDAAHLFAKGNEFYKLKQYDRAIEAYEEILSQGWESPEVFLNIGNCYYRKGKLGYSILFYERAKKISANDEDINHNLLIAYSRTTDKIETLPSVFIFQWWESLVTFFSTSGWTIFSYILFLIVLFFVGLFFLTKNQRIRKISFFAGITSVAIFVMSILILSIRINNTQSLKYAVVVQPSVTVKSSPDKNSVDSFILHEGIKVRIEDKVDLWYKLRLEDGKIGWVEKKSFEFI